MNQYSDKINCILEEGKICKSKMTVIGPTGPRGQIGPTGPTERLFKSSNKIIIDSS